MQMLCSGAVVCTECLDAMTRTENHDDDDDDYADGGNDGATQRGKFKRI